MSSRSPEAQREALEWWRGRLAEVDSMSETEAFDFLGSGLRKLPRQSIFQLEEKWPIYEQIRTKMLSIPGHAEYYAGEIDTLVAERQQTPVGLADFNREAKLIFETLSHLPSEQTVEVLGRYVERTDGARDLRAETLEEWMGSRPDLKGFVPLWMMAIDALHALPIENAPEQRMSPTGKPTGKPDWEEWRKWTIRVKEGRLSYKFKGDDKIYPTGTKAPPYAGPERGPPGSRDQMRSDADDVARSRTAGDQAGSISAGARRLWPWVVGIAVLTVPAWWFVLRKK